MIFKLLIKNIKRFGVVYTINFILVKLHILKDFSLKSYQKRQVYYSTLKKNEQINELCQFYRKATGKILDIENPKLFSEKIQWMKIYDSTTIKSLLSDKYEASKYIEKNFKGRIKTVPILGVWEDANDIDFKLLPQKFVLKCTHGSAMNLIIKDKEKINIKKITKKLNAWLKLDYATMNGMYENQYTAIKHRIIAEEFIQEMDGKLHDYKFHCFSGEPKYCQLIGDRTPNSHEYQHAFYTMNWEKTNISYNNHKIYKNDFEMPEKFEEMKKIAKDLAKGFKYVRVDFYLINNEIYFGELTFTPDSGIFIFNDKDIDEKWGKLIHLS